MRRKKSTPTTFRLDDDQRAALLRESVMQMTSQSALIAAYCDRLAKRHAAEDKRKESAQ